MGCASALKARESAVLSGLVKDRQDAKTLPIVIPSHAITIPASSPLEITVGRLDRSVTGPYGRDDLNECWRAVAERDFVGRRGHRGDRVVDLNVRVEGAEKLQARFFQKNVDAPLELTGINKSRCPRSWTAIVNDRLLHQRNATRNATEKNPEPLFFVPGLIPSNRSADDLVCRNFRQSNAFKHCRDLPRRSVIRGAVSNW